MVNRLQDLNYRVQAFNDLASLLRYAQSEGPMLVVMDLESSHEEVCRTIAALKADGATQHVPIIAFAPEQAVDRQAAAQAAGATLAVGEATIANYLPQLLNQALQVL